MDFTLNEELRSIQTLANDFARAEIAPFAAQWDKTHHFPLDCLKKAASLGFAGIYVGTDVGGTGLNRLAGVIIFESLARHCLSTAAYLSVHNMVAWLIDGYGDTAQRQQWLPAMLTMERLASYCLTEPNAGSDAASLQTTAVREGEYYRVNGAKSFITGGSTSDLYACMVRTGETGPNGISCLLIEKGTPGLHFGKPEEKLGWNNHATTTVHFDDCRVPLAHLIGTEGMGFKIALSALNGGRLNIAACALGAASECFRLALEHMQDRQQFGRKLAEFQALQFKLAERLTDLETARLLLYRAACALDQQDPRAPLYCAMAKRNTTDVAFQVSNDALQWFGGYGYLQDYPIERYFRDIRVTQILEGSNEIMRLIVARGLLKDTHPDSLIFGV